MFERASFFGFRIIIILYITSEALGLPRADALKVFGWFSISIFISQIIGGLLGDLVIGNKKSIILGAIIQTIGVFSLFIPDTIGLYIGLSLVSIGSGLYSPNIVSNFGKLYLSKDKVMDSGFTLWYLAVNLGSFLGIALTGIAAERYGWNIGFTIAGVLMLFSILPIIISKEPNPNKLENKDFSINKRVLNIAIAVILVGLFWSIYKIANIRILDLQLEFSETSALNIPKDRWSYINSILIFPISILAIILWTYRYSSQFFKLTLGFIFRAISFGILLFIPEIPNDHHVVLYLLAALFLSVSEIHIAPIIHSVLTKYTNPKYLAIVISLVSIPTMLFAWIFGFFNERFYNNPILGLTFAIIAMSCISIGLVFMLWRKKNNTHLQ